MGQGRPLITPVHSDEVYVSGGNYARILIRSTPRLVLLLVCDKIIIETK